MKINYLAIVLFSVVAIAASAQTNKKNSSAKKPQAEPVKVDPVPEPIVAPVVEQPAIVVSTDLPRPKLVVGIVVDQMRWDYLYRYYSRYGNNGFKRLLNEGFSCENNNLDYIPTVTAVGHTSVYTGSVPALNGIAGNDFIVQATGKSMYCTDDTSVRSVGAVTDAGKMSPRNLLTTTVTDELRLATNFKSKVIGIALKDRGGILPAGHTANAAYWFDDKSGNWITSTYYMNELPQWMKDFNDQKLPETYLKLDWTTLYPIETYTLSTPDDNKYEGAFKGMDAPTMPVKTSALYKSAGLGLIRTTPYGNTMTIDLAVAAINGEQLGQRDITDFLALSLSSTDYIGHQFGINAIEIEDTYLRLDRDIASFLTYLDAKIGVGNYTVFLTADHGAAHNPTFLQDHNIPAAVWDDGTVLKDLNKFLSDKYKIDGLVISLLNYQVNLNNYAINYIHMDENALKNDCIRFLEKVPGVAFAIDMKKAGDANIPEELRTRIINGYNIEHSGAIQIILKPGYFSGKNTTGTTHGTWNPYDAHNPFVLMGWGIQHGKTNRETHMTDIAPTIAALLHIQAPNGSIGKVVYEALK